MEVVAIAALATAAAAGTASYSQGQQEKRMAKTQARNQQRAIAEEKAAALETRKGQIDQQRAMMGVRGQGTRGTSSSGVRATIGGTTDTLG